MTLTLSSADGYQLVVLQTKYEHCNLKSIGVRENVEFSGPGLADRQTDRQKDTSNTICPISFDAGAYNRR